MEGNYAVAFKGRHCGKVQVLQQGLYYRFICRCQIKEDILCRLNVSCGGKQEELGVLIPADGGFGLDKKIPMKHFAEGVPEFCLHTKGDSRERRFIPIVSAEPFSYIAKVKDAYLARRNGLTGMII